MSGLMRNVERVNTDKHTSRKFYRPCEVALRMGLSTEQVLRHLRAKRIPGYKMGRSWVIPVSVLDSIAAAAGEIEHKT